MWLPFSIWDSGTLCAGLAEVCGWNLVGLVVKVPQIGAQELWGVYGAEQVIEKWRVGEAGDEQGCECVSRETRGVEHVLGTEVRDKTDGQ